jgi:hypothetical protein
MTDGKKADVHDEQEAPDKYGLDEKRWNLVNILLVVIEYILKVGICAL